MLNTLQHFIIPVITTFKFPENVPRDFTRYGLAGRAFSPFSKFLVLLSDLKARRDGSVGVALEQVGIAATDLLLKKVFRTKPEETMFSFAEL
ncbi:MAG: hypothetical protein ABI980_09130 [Nitrospirota bacterium]